MKCEIRCNVSIRKFCLCPIAILSALKIPVPAWMFKIETEIVEVN